MSREIHKKDKKKRQKCRFSLRYWVCRGYSAFQMVHAPYASPAYAARSASGPSTRTTTDTAIIASPSNDVRSANLFLIQFVILTPYLVEVIVVEAPFAVIGDTPLGV